MMVAENVPKLLPVSSKNPKKTSGGGKKPGFSIFMLEKSWNRNLERSTGKGDFIFVGTRVRLTKNMGQGESAVETLAKVQGH